MNCDTYWPTIPPRKAPIGPPSDIPIMKPTVEPAVVTPRPIQSVFFALPEPSAQPTDAPPIDISVFTQMPPGIAEAIAVPAIEPTNDPAVPPQNSLVAMN